MNSMWPIGSLYRKSVGLSLRFSPLKDFKFESERARFTGSFVWYDALLLYPLCLGLRLAIIVPVILIQIV